MNMFNAIPSNMVQSIRAYRSADLQQGASELGHHFCMLIAAKRSQKTRSWQRSVRPLVFLSIMGITSMLCTIA